jgi:hypothetical protein
MAALKIGTLLTFLIYFTCVDSWAWQKGLYAVPKGKVIVITSSYILTKTKLETGSYLFHYLLYFISV